MNGDNFDMYKGWIAMQKDHECCQDGAGRVADAGKLLWQQIGEALGKLRQQMIDEEMRGARERAEKRFRDKVMELAGVKS